jgi:two-component system response regulator AtoC
LRDRTEDIEPLCAHFIEGFNRKLGKRVQGLDPQALEVLQRVPWPGNVRELANVMEMAMIVASGTQIAVEDLPPHLLAPPPVPVASPEGNEDRASGALHTQPSDLSLEAAEREQIRRALEAAAGRRIDAARLLGLSRRTLYRKLEKYGLE